MEAEQCGYRIRELTGDFSQKYEGLEMVTGRGGKWFYELQRNAKGVYSIY